MDTIMMTRDCLRRTAHGSGGVTAVVVYEDSATDARASEFCVGVAKHLGSGAKLGKQMWLLNELRLPRLSEIAAGDVSQADLLIVSLHHTETVPEELQAWVTLWLAKEPRRMRLLIALFDSVHGGLSAALRAYLQSVAHQTGMQFLIQSEETFEDA